MNSQEKKDKSTKNNDALSNAESSIRGDKTMELLSPWELPSRYELSVDDYFRATGLLNDLIEILKDNILEAPDSAAHIISTLKHVKTALADIKETKTPIKVSELQDYDLYFRTPHVVSEQPIFSLIKGLATSVTAFAHMCADKNISFSTSHVQLQIDGYITYCELLLRSCEIIKVTAEDFSHLKDEKHYEQSPELDESSQTKTSKSSSKALDEELSE